MAAESSDVRFAPESGHQAAGCASRGRFRSWAPCRAHHGSGSVFFLAPHGQGSCRQRGSLRRTAAEHSGLRRHSPVRPYDAHARARAYWSRKLSYIWFFRPRLARLLRRILLRPTTPATTSGPPGYALAVTGAQRAHNLAGVCKSKRDYLINWPILATIDLGGDPCGPKITSSLTSCNNAGSLR